MITGYQRYPKVLGCTTLLSFPRHSLYLPVSAVFLSLAILLLRYWQKYWQFWCEIKSAWLKLRASASPALGSSGPMRRSICGSPRCMHMYVSLFLVLYMPADSTCLQDGIPEERRKNLAARAVDVYCGTRKIFFTCLGSSWTRSPLISTLEAASKLN